ncbi:molybdenum cofactor guanylyltransferase [Tenacibaculum jejuense]|uniref:Probable molybdenum cofactor guanylyltransferase n=1 Tax=Tenacibaculum jejuense TaxID=584609 RepID=A0A238UAT9_9FLAO|nr:molybdenum cofactor guanylyltransferase [Tenacibaculum jejuense]SNR16289.1 Molybdopterin-guanine dinucleotide synthase [Tenacibaculum jejuense]
MKNNNITGIVLAGGKSSRMGTDKSKIVFNGKTFIEHSISALECITSDIIIISNTSDHDTFSYERIPDEIQNFGPVAGIYSGLKAIKTEYAIILSCDIPLINSYVLNKLVHAIDNEFDIIQFEYQDKATPLIALYHKNCLSRFEHAINHKIHRLQSVVNTCNPKNILLSEKDAIYIRNINTIEDLKRIEEN